jgi:hypothetical protein
MTFYLEEIMIMYSFDALKNKMLIEFSKDYMMGQQEDILLERLKLIKFQGQVTIGLQFLRTNMHMLGAGKFAKNALEKKIKLQSLYNL